MKQSLIMTLILSSFITFTSQSLLADAPTTQPGQMIAVLEELKSKGFVIIKKIDFDVTNGTYAAKVLNAQGKNIDIQVNPQTGEVTKTANEILGLSTLEVAMKVKEAGFPNIYEITTELFGNQYIVKTIDDHGHKVTMNVDFKTGKILKTTKE